MLRALILCSSLSLGCSVNQRTLDPDEPDPGTDALVEARDALWLRDASLPRDASPPPDIGLILDAALRPDAARDAALEPDASPPLDEPCLITFGEEIGVCCIIPVRSMTGCDDVVRCLCGLQNSDDVEACMAQNLIPRGAITLADYCARSGLAHWGETLSLAALFDDEAPITDHDMPLPRPISSNEACEEVAAFSTWMEPDGFGLSLGTEGADLTVTPSSDLEGYDLETPPLLSMEDVEGYLASELTFYLSEQGQARLAAIDLMELVRRPFLLHAYIPVISGHWASLVLSSVDPGASIHVEEVSGSEHRVLKIYGEVPSREPASPEQWRADHLARVLASHQKLLDAACISTCGCPEGRGCREGTCAALPEGCQGDADCCQAQCVDGICIR